MTPCRQRMIEALQLRGLSARTQEMYVRAVRQLAEPSHKAPERITAEARRASFLSLQNEQHYARAASPMALCGIQCCYEPTLKRDWTTRTFVRPPQEHKLPVLLSRDDVRTLLPCVRFPRSRTCLTTLDACGLRLQEGPHVHMPDMDRARLCGHVRWGTGAKDRSVPLPHQTLEGLRQSWPPPHPGVAFSGSGPSWGREGPSLCAYAAPQRARCLAGCAEGQRPPQACLGAHVTPLVGHPSARGGRQPAPHPPVLGTQLADHDRPLYPSDRQR
jgi:integrase